MHQADDEWKFPNRATPLGSPAYYAVRFSPEHLRERYALLFGWHRLIEDIADRPHDPGVARIKLDWWRNEVATLAGSGSDVQPRHPLTLALADCAPGVQSITHMNAVVLAAEQSIVDPQPADSLSFATRCRGIHGQFFAALATATPSQPFSTKDCIEAGAYCAAVDRIRQLAQHPHRAPADITAGALSGMTPGERRQRLDQLLAQFQPPAATEVGALPGILRRMLALSSATHQKLRRKGYPVHETLIDRPPIAHLWTAWRCR